MNELPSILESRPNFLLIEVGNVQVWFSYKTPVAFQVHGHPLVARQNEWGPTTGKHLNAIGGEKKARVDADTFHKLFKQQVPKP